MDDSFFGFSKQKYIFLGLLCVVQNLFAYWWMRGHSIWLILAAAFWGILFFTPLAFDLVPRMRAARRERETEASHGVHYMFGRTAVRVLYSAGQIWLAAEDVYDALGVKPRAEELRRLQISQRHSIVPGTQIMGISEAHLRSCVAGTRSPEAQRFMLWFEREVAWPIKNRVAQRMHIPEEVE